MVGISLFSNCFYEDLKRFWLKEVIYNELITRGFEVNLKVKYAMEAIKVKDYLHYAENRDISVLTIINDNDYKDGLERMKYDVENTPDKTIINDFAELFCMAKKL